MAKPMYRLGSRRAFNGRQQKASDPELPLRVLVRAVHGILAVTSQRSVCILGFVLIVHFTVTGQAPGTKLWEVDVRGDVSSSPAVGADGTIYVAATPSGSPGGLLWAISPEGRPLWMRLTGGGVNLSSPSVGPDGTIYLGTATGQLFAFSPAGRTNWIFRTGESKPVSSPALGVDGTIYIRAYGQRYDGLYSVGAEGGTNWQIGLGSSAASVSRDLMSSPAIGADGTVYVASGSSNLYAISPTGSTNWSFALGARTYASPALGPDGTLYIGAEDSFVYALDRTGGLKWRYLASGFVESSAAVGADGSVYVGYYARGQGGLLALTRTGELRWSLDQGEGISASPAIDDAGNVYIPELFSGWFRAVNSSGSNIWSLPTGIPAFSSPVIGLEGTLYVGGGTKLYALVGGRPPMPGAWAMFGGGSRHTRRVPQLAIQCSPPLPDGSIDLLMRTEIDRNYEVQRSSNLLDWSLLLAFRATNWNSTLRVPTGALSQEFFRLQSPPG